MTCNWLIGFNIPLTRRYDVIIHPFIKKKLHIVIIFILYFTAYAYKQVTKKDADLFGSCDRPIPPSCLVTVWANRFSKPKERFRFPVTLTGINSNTKKIDINRFLEAVETSHRGI